MNLFRELKQMLSSDNSDKLSSKRVITFLSFILISIGFLGNMFFNLKVDENMFDGIIQIVWAGLGFVLSEHLLKKRNTKSTED